MGGVINDIWILTIDGIVLFNTSENERVDTQLFGGLLSAITNFAKEISDSYMDNFVISNDRYYMKKENRLLFVIRTSKKIAEKTVNLMLKSIKEKFLIMYPEDFFETWDYNTNDFLDFKEEIKDIAQIKVENFLSAI